MTATYAKYWAFLWQAIAARGWLGALSDAGEDWLFDLRHGIRTVGARELAGLDVKGAHLAEGVQYQGAPVRVFRKLIDELPPESFAYPFIDYGCGKGRALMLAKAAGFRTGVGVEFSRELAVIARKNLAVFRPSQKDGGFEVCHADACEFLPPAGPLVLFFYNPFGPKVLEIVLSRVLEDPARGDIWVVYINPLWERLFRQRGFEEKFRLASRTGCEGVVLLRLAAGFKVTGKKP